ncbi:MAG: BACON domain-containing carbohydrate-binding protein [Candidatus Limnocylindrales bacterium]
MHSVQTAVRTLGFMAVFATVHATNASASSSGYVYVAVKAAACAQATPCAAPRVLIVDAATAEIATSIDLPVHTIPAGLAISPDGTRLYVSNFGAEFAAANSLTVIDARRNVLLSTVMLASTQYGPLAVGADPSRVFLLNSKLETLKLIDASTGAELRSVTARGLQVVASGPLNRVFVGGTLIATGWALVAYDADTLAPIGSRSGGATTIRFRASRDGLRLFDIQFNFNRASNGFFGAAIDAATLAETASYRINNSGAPIDLSADELVTVGPDSPFPGAAIIVRRFWLSGAAGSGKSFPTLPNLGDFTLPSPGNRIFVLNPSTGATTANLLAAIDINSYAVVRTIPLSESPSFITSTPWGVASCTYAVNRTYVPLARTTPTATVSLTTDCGWTASASESWIHLSQTTGSGNATLTLTLDPNQGGSPREGTVIFGGRAILVRQAGFAFQPPFGVMDTPVDGAAVQGSIAVTGWALDDIAVQRVEIWRDLQPGETTTPFSSTASDPRHGKVFIANGTFVDGARPDVAALYPSLPSSARAGWGYLLLTWGLWNQGNGTYKLHAYAFDEESNVTSIGSKTMVINNNAATKPFGSIDTPGIGGEASGPNFGWALTPNVNGVATCRIPASGVQVSIDSGPLQPVVYGTARTDVAGTFQGMSNSNAAGGHFIFDWSTLANGPHTIGWLVTDDCGRAEGIGSRFFNVSTGTTASSQTGQARALAMPSSMVATDAPEQESAEPVLVRRGDSELEQRVSAESGVRVIDVQPGARIQIRLPHGYTEAYQVVSTSERRPLPIGSTWDPASGTLYWQPAPGFLGSFVIRFGNGLERISVRVQITP